MSNITKRTARGNFLFAALTLGTAGMVSIIAAFVSGYMFAAIGNKTFGYVTFLVLFLSGVGCFYLIARIAKKLKTKYNQDVNTKVAATL